MRRLWIFLVSGALLLPLISFMPPAVAATLRVTIDPNTYSGSGNITDSTSGIVGTPSNLTYSAGTNCGVFTFGGNSTISFPSTDFGNQFSISAWVNPTSGGSSIQTLFSNAGANTNTNGFKAYWNTWNTSDLKMIVEDGNGSTGTSTFSTSAQVTNSTWQHLVYTINKTTSTITMYRNGTAVTIDGTALVSNVGTNQSWWLGAIGGSSYYMRAQVGLVKIYSTVLTSAEVTADYNSASARYATTPTCPTPAAPSNSAVPTISGTTAYSSALTATTGTWSPAPTGYTYQWQSAATSGGTYSNIPGATSSTYTPVTADIGNYLKVQVTATNAGGSNTATSAATTVIAKATQATLTVSANITTDAYPYTQALTLTPSGGSGTGAVTSAIASGGTASGCSLSTSDLSPTITATSSGTCLISITKATDSNYNAATSASITFTFTKASASTLTITTTSGMYTQTLTLQTSGGLSSASDTFSVTSGPCTVSGSTLTPTANGTCYVTAYRAADTNYTATTSSSTAIAISKAMPGLSFSFSSEPIYRQSTTISVVATTAGSIKFMLNGKALPGCQSRPANAGNGYTATCAWKPATRNFASITMAFTPVNTSYYSGAINGPTFLIKARSGLR